MSTLRTVLDVHRLLIIWQHHHCGTSWLFLNYYPPAKPLEKTCTTDLTKYSYTCLCMREGRLVHQRLKHWLYYSRQLYYSGRTCLSTAEEDQWFTSGTPAHLDAAWQRKTSQGSMTLSSRPWHLLVSIWLENTELPTSLAWHKSLCCVTSSPLSFCFTIQSTHNKGIRGEGGGQSWFDDNSLHDR